MKKKTQIITAVLIVMSVLSGCGSTVTLAEYEVLEKKYNEVCEERDELEEELDDVKKELRELEDALMEESAGWDDEAVEVPAAAAHEHTWEDATAYDPKTCSTCGATEGVTLFEQCGSWEEFLRRYYFNDDFVYEEIALSAGGTANTVYFETVEDVRTFVVQVFTTCLTIAGLLDTDSTTWLFGVGNEFTIICSCYDMIDPLPAEIITALSITEGSTLGAEAQEVYDNFFVALGYDINTK